MAQQMAAMQNLLNSMTPEQRAQLQGLAEALLDDMDLRWQVDRLGANLRQAFPRAGWDRRPQNFQRPGPARFRRGGRPDEPAGRHGPAGEPADPPPAVPAPWPTSTSNGPVTSWATTAARSLERLAELTKLLEEAGLIEQREGRLELTPKGMRRIGQNALSDLFTHLAKDRMGRHQADPAGIGHERAYETKPYEFGDPFNLNIERTVRNAIQRGRGRHAGAAVARRTSRSSGPRH